jgi:MFS family permease
MAEMPRLWAKLLARPRLQAIQGVVFTSGVSQGAGGVVGILFMTERLGLGPREVGLVFTANVLTLVAASSWATRVSDRARDRARVMLPGRCTMAASAAAAPFCATPEPYVALGVVAAIGNSFVMPNVSPVILDNVSEPERAQALAVRNVCQDTGMLVGAGASGLLAHAVGVPSAMLAVAATQATTTLFFAVRSGALRPSEPPDKG